MKSSGKLLKSFENQLNRANIRFAYQFCSFITSLDRRSLKVSTVEDPSISHLGDMPRSASHAEVLDWQVDEPEKVHEQVSNADEEKQKFLDA